MTSSQLFDTRDNVSRHENAASNAKISHKTGHTKSSVRSDDVAILRPRDSITAPDKFLPSNLAETKRRDFPGLERAEKRKRDDGDEHAISLLNSFMSPATEKIQQPLKVNSKELVQHIHNNVAFLFFAKSGGAPRVRLLSTCDSVQKVFAQALAGDVFADTSGSGTRVLALASGWVQRQTRSLVEDDDEDFEDFVTALKMLDCWVKEEGSLQGSLTVEVRAR